MPPENEQILRRLERLEQQAYWWRLCALALAVAMTGLLVTRPQPAEAQGGTVVKAPFVVAGPDGTRLLTVEARGKSSDIQVLAPDGKAAAHISADARGAGLTLFDNRARLGISLDATSRGSTVSACLPTNSVIPTDVAVLGSTPKGARFYLTDQNRKVLFSKP